MPHTLEELRQLHITPREIQHNQHRRAPWQDYSDAALYMITLCIEGRLPLFGKLAGDFRNKRGTTDFPHIELSTLGRAILEEELPKIHHFYPQVEIWQATIMPDHLHLLLRVTAPLPRNRQLGDVISGFKGGCSQAWWRLHPSSPAPASSSAVVPASSNTAVVPVSSDTAVVPLPFGAGPSPSSSASIPAPSSPAAVPAPSGAGPSPSRPSLFEPGYHDRIIKRPGMLENIKQYMADNPLRAIMRRQLPQLLERRLHLRIGTHDYAAFGAIFLLKRAEKEQVFYHRKDKETGAPTETTEAFRNNRDRQLAEARDGVVLVSPSISRGESIVINAAIQEGLPVIHLQKEPISRYWKPERRRFEACARGSLLILSPWGLDEELTPAPNGTGTPAIPSDYARFHRLNDLAAEICATTEAVLLNIKEII